MKASNTRTRVPLGNTGPASSRSNGLASRPFVFVNVAMTADGKIATANRSVSSFASKRDLEYLYELRATADAVMNGARTIDIGGVTLGTGGKRFREMRLRSGLPEYNLRIVVSGAASIDPNARIFKQHRSPLIILTTRRAPLSRVRRLRALADEVLFCGTTQIDFAFAFRHLREKWNVRRLLCEGGGALNGTLFRARLVDELHLTICPRIFGDSNAPTLADGTQESRLSEASKMRLKTSRRIGDELFLVYRRSTSSD
jgi:2,5-diamino-6-(ribosylamino)-4(3H)-pyrimidinone 5'-phosphate reductase